MTSIRVFSDDDLIQTIKLTDRINEPLKFLYQTHFPSLSLYIEQNNGSAQDAEDVFQETMLTFIELVRLNKFRGESSVKTFLFAVNRNIWLNELKKKGRLKKHHLQYVKSSGQMEESI